MGSQLYALSFIQNLQEIYPSRRIVLIHHTAGVTSRQFELKKQLDSRISLRIIDDFSEYKNPGKFRLISSKKLLIHIIKHILKIMKLYTEVNSKQELENIRSWTFEIRGHYSNLEISSKFVKNFLNSIGYYEEKITRIENKIALHYRLGDLLTLEEKSPIEPAKLSEIIIQIIENSNLKTLDVYSDSVQTARIFLEDKINSKVLAKYYDLPTLEVIQNCIRAEYFIGTNSKISDWITRFRAHLGLESINITY